MEEKFTRKITQDDFITEKNDVIKNNLLGNYDDKNEYHISQQIVEELISIDKLKKSTFGNSVFCVGNLLGYGEIAFEVVYNNKTNDSQAQAFLFVLENVDKINGYLQNTIRTQIAHFTSDLDDFIEESYQKFNIVGTLDDEGKVKKNLDDMNLDDSYILAKKAYSLLLDKLEDEKVLDAYGKYFTARLALLTKFDNPFTNEILSHFNEEYTLIHGVFLQQKNYKTLNELLDKCIEEISGTKNEYVKFEEEFNNAIREDLDKFITSMQTINDKSADKAIDMLDKGDREKIKEILSSKQIFEKDLSEEGVLSDNVVAPKQSLETLANELEDLVKPNEIPETMSLNIETPIAETGFDTFIEEASFDNINNDISTFSEGSEGSEQIISEEVEPVDEVDNNVDIGGIKELFALEDEEASEEVFEETEEREEVVVNDGGQLYGQLLDHIEEKPFENSELDVDSEPSDVEEIVSLFKDNEETFESVAEENYVENDSIVEEIPEVEDMIEEEDVIEEEEIAHKEINSLSNEFKESASMSIVDRLNKLKNNVQKGNVEYKKPRPQNTNGKLDRLYDLLDRSMDK